MNVQVAPPAWPLNVPALVWFIYCFVAELITVVFAVVAARVPAFALVPSRAVSWKPHARLVVSVVVLVTVI